MPRASATGSAAHLGEAEHDVAQRRQVRKQIVALEDHADAGPLPGEFAAGQATSAPAARAVAEKVAVEPDLAAVVFFEEVDAAQERRLARAAGADDRDHVGGQDVEVDAAQDRMGPEGFRQALDGQNGVHAVS